MRAGVHFAAGKMRKATAQAFGGIVSAEKPFRAFSTV